MTDKPIARNKKSKNPFKRFFNRQDKIPLTDIQKERIRVEKEYAKTHQITVTVVEPETRAEMRLTKKGNYELGSDGRLTANGLQKRLKHRYNLAIIWLVILIVVAYVTFFTVNF